MKRFTLVVFLTAAAGAQPVRDSSSLAEKARRLQKDLIDRHLIDGLYVSIVPTFPRLSHTVDEPGNVIHAGVWTGRYLAGVGYQYAVTKDPWVRRHGQVLLEGLRRLQEVTGKPGLLARGYVRGHGPVEDWERAGRDSKEWHQGQGKFADYRWYGDVSVDNFNAVLYGYAIYYDLAADADQKKWIAYDVDRLMTHLLDNQCRIVDVDGEVTLYGHVGIDPDPARDEYYQRVYGSRLQRYQVTETGKLPLRAQLMLLPDLVIAHHVTGKQRYLDYYTRVVERFRANPDTARNRGPYSPERLARLDHSPEGQAYEALYNLVRYEKDGGLGRVYREWVADLWEANWTEGNSLFAFMTMALLPDAAHKGEGLAGALDTLRTFPVDRVFRPVMNSLRKDIEVNPHNPQLSAKPLPVHERPHDNEYEWKGNPYRLDGWLKPTVLAFAASCDDPQVAWFADSTGRLYFTRDGWKTWTEVSQGLMGARVQKIAAHAARTFVLHALTDRGVFVTRDGGLSWRPAEEAARFEEPAKPAAPISMRGWRIAVRTYAFQTPRGILAGGPGGAYLSKDGSTWEEMKLWREEETGAADFLHAYWMGRHYRFVR